MKKVYRYRNDSPKFRKLLEELKSRSAWDGIYSDFQDLKFTHCIVNTSNVYSHPEYKLKARKDPCGNLGDLPRVLRVSCDNCEQHCEFSILQSAEVARAARFCKDKMKAYKYCPKHNIQVRSITKKGATLVPWVKPNVTHKEKPSDSFSRLGFKRNELGGLVVPLPRK